MQEHKPKYPTQKFCATCRLVYPSTYRNCSGYPEKQISGCGHMLRQYAKGKKGRMKRLEEVPRY